METTDNTTTTKVKFIDNHKPALTVGEYEINIKQEIISSKITVENKIPELKRKFSVAGPRFELNPNEIRAVFPPDNSIGDHGNVLPHIMFERSTLPWERNADNKDESSQWLALLLFTGDEIPVTQTITLKELMETTKSDPKINFPNLKPENGQKDDDKVSVIDVKKPLLAKILPSKDDLQYLTHVREGLDAQDKQIGEETAVLFCNRLPSKDANSVVHLVSIENRYNPQGFDFQKIKDDDLIRLVSLKSWRFTCESPKHTFENIVQNLNKSTGKTDQYGTLRLPDISKGNKKVKRYLDMGSAPLKHELRQGGTTISWYHGPLVPYDNVADITLPVRSADQLVRFNKDDGMFDVSYAGAWELGRLLTLQSKNISTQLYNWKRSLAREVKLAEQELTYTHLPVPSGDIVPMALIVPSEISMWFYGMGHLKGVPFNYIVPDEQMLPQESLRFFYLDQKWIRALLDGAFSIGRVTSSDYEIDHDQIQKSQNLLAEALPSKVTGFLLRSSVVSGWPDLQVDGYSELIKNTDPISNKTKKLDLLRMDRLSPNVLLCLFKGDIQTLDIYPKPEALHFGVDIKEETGRTGFYKKLRDGEKIIEPLPWREEGMSIIDISRLANLIKKGIGSSGFALEMIEKLQKVRFTKKS